VIDEQIRRGRRMAEELDDDPRTGERYDREPRRRPGYREEPRSGYGEEREPGYGGGGFRLLGMPLRHLESLMREILRQIGSARPDPWRLAELLFRLQIEAISELARLGFGALGMAAPRWGDAFTEDADRVERDIDESLDDIEDMDEDVEEEELDEDERWDWPAAPSVPAVIRSTVPIPVYVWSHERTEIDLELPPGAQSLDLLVEPLLATGTDQPALPAFGAEFAALAYGLVVLRIEVPRELPAGRYRRRVLVRATGEPVGDLTVQVGIVPVVTVPPVAAAPKKARRR